MLFSPGGEDASLTDVEPTGRGTDSTFNGAGITGSTIGNGGTTDFNSGIKIDFSVDIAAAVATVGIGAETVAVVGGVGVATVGGGDGGRSFGTGKGLTTAGVEMMLGDAVIVGAVDGDVDDGGAGSGTDEGEDAGLISRMTIPASGVGDPIGRDADADADADALSSEFIATGKTSWKKKNQ